MPFRENLQEANEVREFMRARNVWLSIHCRLPFRKFVIRKAHGKFLVGKFAHGSGMRAI
jgi:hypothetical protein